MSKKFNGGNGVSVVVCCYNSERRLPDTLQHLACQAIPDGLAWEVVVVDNASSDNTADIAEREWRRCGGNVPIRIIHEPTPGLSAARQSGINAAMHGYVLFVDDDNWLAPNYVGRAASVMENDASIGILGGWGVPVFESETPEWFSEYSHYFAVGRRHERTGNVVESTYTVYGAGMVLRKSAWDRIKQAGFQSILNDRVKDKLSSGQDHELCLAIALAGYRIQYDESLVFKHFLPKERLKWNYILKLTEGIHRSSIYLTPYYSVLDNGNKKNRAKRFLWVSESARILKAIAIRYLRYRRSKLTQGSSRAHLQRLKRLQGELKGWLAIRWSYSKIFNCVEDLKRNLDKSFGG